MEIDVSVERAERHMRGVQRISHCHALFATPWFWKMRLLCCGMLAYAEIIFYFRPLQKAKDSCRVRRVSRTQFNHVKINDNPRIFLRLLNIWTDTCPQSCTHKRTHGTHAAGTCSLLLSIYPSYSLFLIPLASFNLVYTYRLAEFAGMNGIQVV